MAIFFGILAVIISFIIVFSIGFVAYIIGLYIFICIDKLMKLNTSDSLLLSIVKCILIIPYVFLFLLFENKAQKRLYKKEVAKKESINKSKMVWKSYNSNLPVKGIDNNNVEWWLEYNNNRISHIINNKHKEWWLEYNNELKCITDNNRKKEYYNNGKMISSNYWRMFGRKNMKEILEKSLNIKL